MMMIWIGGVYKERIQNQRTLRAEVVNGQKMRNNRIREQFEHAREGSDLGRASDV